jgi:hypothetical protein
VEEPPGRLPEFSVKRLELPMKLDSEIMIPPDLRRLLRDIKTVHPNPLNARTHNRKQRRKLAKIIRNVGFINPIVVDEKGMILAGHGRYAAAVELGMTLIPVIVLSEMTEAQKRAYALADNQLATLAGWDRGLLATELGILSGELSGLGLTVTDLGFSVGEINALIEDRGPATGDPADATPRPARISSLAQVRTGNSDRSGTRSIAATRGRIRMLKSSCAAPRLTWPLSTNPTTSPFRASRAVVVQSSTTSLQWPRVRCRARPSKRSPARPTSF